LRAIWISDGDRGDGEINSQFNSIIEIMIFAFDFVIFVYLVADSGFLIKEVVELLQSSGKLNVLSRNNYEKVILAKGSLNQATYGVVWNLDTYDAQIIKENAWTVRNFQLAKELFI
jgi:hypothetical protein